MCVDDEVADVAYYRRLASITSVARVLSQAIHLNQLVH